MIQSETGKYLIYIGGEKYGLRFDRKTEFGGTGKDVKRTVYLLNPKKYTDISSLNCRVLSEIRKDVFLCEDIYGNKALYCYREIPTFDPADREWDSWIKEYLMYDGKQVNLAVCRGGYKIARLTVYEELLEADMGLYAYLERLGYPAGSEPKPRMPAAGGPR